MDIYQFYLDPERKRIAVFMHDPFSKYKSTRSSALHTHDYAEMHLTEMGECKILAADKTVHSVAGTLTVSPAGTVHRLCVDDPDAFVHHVFMIDYEFSATLSKMLDVNLVKELGEQIRAYRKNSDFGIIASYISFFLKDMVKRHVELLRVFDRRFVIHEFFTNRYHTSVSVSDLATALALSEKQTARLVKSYMGDSFSRVITDYRMRAARLLMEMDASLTLTDISSMVGYSSYSGFWKAFKRCNDNLADRSQKAPLPSGEN